MPTTSSPRPPSSSFAPIAAGLVGGYVQNAIARRVSRKLGGGVVRRLLVSILVSWLVGKAVRYAQARVQHP